MRNLSGEVIYPVAPSSTGMRILGTGFVHTEQTIVSYSERYIFICVDVCYLKTYKNPTQLSSVEG